MEDGGHNRHAVAIALGVLGPFLALSGAAAAFFWLRRKRRLSRLKAAPWFARMSVASDERQIRRDSSTFMETAGTSPISIHGGAGTCATIPSFYVGSASQTADDANSEVSKPPSYDFDSDTYPTPGAFSPFPFLEKN